MNPLNFGLANLSLDAAVEEKQHQRAPNSPIHSRDTDTQQAHVASDLAELIRTINDVKHHTTLDNLYGQYGFFNTLISHPVGTGSSFQVRKVDGVDSKRPLVAKYPRLHSQVGGARKSGLSRTVIRSVSLEIQALCHEPLRRHPNVVDLLGLGWAHVDAFENHVLPVLFLEFATHGTLQQYLADNDTTPAARLELGRQIGYGLKALHASAIVHGDLNVNNVLIFDSQNNGVTAKLADFGSTIQAHDFTIQHKRGTRPWNAPEWQQTMVPSLLKQLDVYSFGLLIWTLCLGGEAPFSSMSFDAIEVRKRQDLIKSDAVQSITDHYEYYSHTYECETETEQLELYIAAVVSPRTVFIETLDFDPLRRDLDRAVSAMTSNIFHSPTNRVKKNFNSDRTLIPRQGRNAYMMLHDVPKIIGSLLIDDFSKRADDQTMPVSSRGELCLQVALAYLDGFAGRTGVSQALDWLVRAVNLGSRAAQGVVYRVFSTVGQHRIRANPDLSTQLKSWNLTAASFGDRTALQDVQSLDEDLFQQALVTSRQRFHLEAAVPATGCLDEELVEAIFNPTTEFPGYIDNRGSIGKIHLNWQLNTFLHCGSAYGVRLEHFERFLTYHRPPLDAQDKKGNTALLLAVRSGCFDHARVLLEHGADPTVQNKLGQLPLHWTIHIHGSVRVKQIVGLLNPSPRDLAICATRSDLGGINYYNQNQGEGSPLHWAVSENHQELVEVLLQVGADPCFVYQDMSPLDLAVRLNAWRLFRELSRYVHEPFPTRPVGSRGGRAGSTETKRKILGDWVKLAMTGFSRHQHLIQHGRLHSEALWRTLVELRRAKAIRGISVQHISLAFQHSNTDAASSLLIFDAFQLRILSVDSLVNVFLEQAGYIMPHVAQFLLKRIAEAANGCQIPSLSRSIFPYVKSLYADAEVLDILFDHIPPFNVDIRDRDGNTPFLEAVKSGNYEVATRLLHRGADPNVDIPAPNGQSYMVNILYYLILVNDDLAIGGMQYLLEPLHPFVDRVPSFVICREQKMTALHSAARWGNQTVFGYLLTKFSDPAMLNMQQYGSDGTALHIAAFHGNYAVARDLVAAGADVNLWLRESGRTAMDCCYTVQDYPTNLPYTKEHWQDVAIGKLQIFQLLEKHNGTERQQHFMHIGLRFLLHACRMNWPKLFEVALKLAPAELRSQELLDTLLFRVSACGSKDLVLQLLSHGANINATTKTGQTPLHKAAAIGDCSTVRVLVQAGADLQMRDEKGRTSAICAFVKYHEGVVRYLVSQGAPDNFPQVSEILLLATLSPQHAEEVVEEEVISEFWTLKWTEDKNGTLLDRTTTWIGGLRAGPNSEILGEMYAQREQEQRRFLSVIRDRRKEGFNEAWSQVANRRKQGKFTQTNTNSSAEDDADEEASPV